MGLVRGYWAGPTGPLVSRGTSTGRTGSGTTAMVGRTGSGSLVAGTVTGEGREAVKLNCGPTFGKPTMGSAGEGSWMAGRPMPAMGIG